MRQRAKLCNVRTLPRLAVSAGSGGRPIGAPRATRLPTALLLAAIALLLLAWAFANPPGASPDERQHDIKAVAAGGGDLRGSPDPTASYPGATAQQLDFLRSVTRSFTIPAALVPQRFGCEGQQPDATAACHNDPPPPPAQAEQLPSYVADYPPTLYLLPGALMRLAGDAVTALLVGRLVCAAVVLALLVAATLLLAPGRRPWLLASLGVAVTPMVLFLGGSLNPNGGEIAAALCFGAACLRIAREQPPPWVWVVAGAAGALLAASRALGPLWVVLTLGVALALVGGRPAMVRLRGAGRPAVVGALLLLAGLVASAAWDVATVGHTLASTASLATRLSSDARMLPGVVLPEQVGVFGFLDVQMPKAVYWAWDATVGALLLTALVLGDVRERLTLVAAAALAVAVTLGVAVFVIDPTGFPTQGRYTLPFTVVVLLLAGEIVARHAERLGAAARAASRAAIPVVLAGAAALQAYAWWSNARRYAVGAHGPFWFVPSAQWSPPGGWWLWIAVVGAATLAMLGAAATAAAALTPPVAASPPGGGARRLHR